MPYLLTLFLTVSLSWGAQTRKNECPIIENLEVKYNSISQEQLDEEFKNRYETIHPERFSGVSQSTKWSPNPFSLNQAQIVALHGYTGEDFDFINTDLWTCSRDLPRIYQYVAEISSALQKSPDYVGMAYRAISNFSPKDDLGTVKKFDTYRVGEIVTFPGFTSSTDDPNFNYFSGPVAMIIHSLHGKLIQSYSGRPGEREVLFDHGTRFKVIGRATNLTKSKLKITLQEM